MKVDIPSLRKENHHFHWLDCYYGIVFHLMIPTHSPFLVRSHLVPEKIEWNTMEKMNERMNK